LEQPPSWNDGVVARNPCVSWAFLFQTSDEETIKEQRIKVKYRYKTAGR